MAEYIDKETVLNLLRDINDDIEEGYGYQYQDWIDEVKNEIPENVVERSKIDKAIEEISEYASIWTSYTMYMSKDQIAVRCLNDYATQFLDILKRNIGEQNN